MYVLVCGNGHVLATKCVLGPAGVRCTIGRSICNKEEEEELKKNA